jgi:nitrogenase molybdenum-iron protein alpha chain
MAMNLEVTEVMGRENRLGSISGYCGSLRDLSCRARCGGIKGRERCFNQNSLCNAACAQGTLSLIMDAAIVNHGPVGCAVDAIGSNFVLRTMQRLSGANEHNIRFLSTNLRESDTVFGASEKLKATIRETWERYKPAAIFVCSSCASAVIGEDIRAAIGELNGEIPVPVSPVFCEGFKSKVWASGFDAAFHAILTDIVKPPAKKTRVVNFINFFGSAKKEITELFARFDVQPYFLTAGSTIEGLSRLSESIATVAICGTLGTYLGTGLEQKYGVPYVQSMRPHGIAGYEDWLRKLGAAIAKTDEVEAYIAEERPKIESELQRLRSRLKGLRAVIGMGPGYSFNFIRVLGELGIEVVWTSAWHFDPKYDSGANVPELEFLAGGGAEDVPFTVSDQQNFEVMNILNTLKPDIYFSRHPGTTVWALKLGYASLCVNDEYTAFGYKGIVNFGTMILDSITNRSFAELFAKRSKLPYTDWWFRQDHAHFLAEAAGSPAGAQAAAIGGGHE